MSRISSGEEIVWDVGEDPESATSPSTVPSPPQTQNFIFDPLSVIRGSNANRYRPCSPTSRTLLQQFEHKHRQTNASNFSPSSGHSSTTTSTVHPSTSFDYSSLPIQLVYQNYPAWRAGSNTSISVEEIKEIFLDLSRRFGFQTDSVNNMFEHFMSMLDSRASRMTPIQALTTLYSDYLGGVQANYCKWYFAAEMDKDDAQWSIGDEEVESLEECEFNKLMERWSKRMLELDDHQHTRQLALYFLIWGEASVIRFAPECLCFLFKCALDFDGSASDSLTQQKLEGDFLREVITPLYLYIRNQTYEMDQRGNHVKRERDHARTVGLDDVNEFFWHRESIQRIVLYDGTSLMRLAPKERFAQLNAADWDKTFRKTYLERRTMLHIFVNFSRVWIIHAVALWYYTLYTSPSLYVSPEKEIAAQETAVQWSIVGLGGAVATLLLMLSSICELYFIPIYYWRKIARILLRLLLLGLVLCLNVGPTVYIVFYQRRGTLSKEGNVKGRTPDEDWQSAFLRHPIQSFAEANVLCPLCFGFAMLCRNIPSVMLVIMIILEFVLFFLDTYLWYVIWSTIFSISLTFSHSICAPWRNIFSQLPNRIYVKLLDVEGMKRCKPKEMVAQIWNAIVIALYREHLISSDHVQNLLYQQIRNEDGSGIKLKPPSFFVSKQDDRSKSEFFPQYPSEAERRITFFAQSLSISLPKPRPIEHMPSFTVLTPHYAEKILLSLREIIHEEGDTRITLLEYLKQLHPGEWENFVQDTKLMDGETRFENLQEHGIGSMKYPGSGRADEMALQCIGFKNSEPASVLRTRIWASLRAQTLYRTLSGFMQYHQAIELLYRLENPDFVKLFHSFPDQLEQELRTISCRKFRLVVSMQRYGNFTDEEYDDTEWLLRAYPDLHIAYLEEEPSENTGEPSRFFSVLINGHCEMISNGKRKPIFRIQLPGYPILGDGKGDNQNSSIIFTRGEYLQLIDANQDNYLEECLKIRNILGEFEEDQQEAAGEEEKSPVAIVGAREYIFSENIGVLGDVAAGKEQTFGTLSQRIMARVGGKLHYGHPDFLSLPFMTTRGGISKGQKGLHLNEDIYAGMMAFSRGGRIKHSEYYQCGKGRDLGFSSIFKFAVKIGVGMGEQTLSREHYYLGTQLPLDRFLTFYYAHPGFHINSIAIMLSLQLFILVLLLLSVMSSTLTLCDPVNSPNTELTPPGCHDLLPIYDWIKRCILSIFIIFSVAFIPLFLQEVMEKGIRYGIVRLGKHFLSLSPLFETFLTQSYSHAMLSNLAFGGAQYISTGRRFTTSRAPFSHLFAQFAEPSIYFAMRIFSMLLFVTLSTINVGGLPHLTYLWVSAFALAFSPFLFNPHQFSLVDFLLDYRQFLRWMSRGNHWKHTDSWIIYCRMSRTKVVGLKRKRLGESTQSNTNQGRIDKLSVPTLLGNGSRAGFFAIFFSQIFTPVLIAFICVAAYDFVKSIPVDTEDVEVKEKRNAVFQVLALAIAPIVANAGVLIALFPTSLLLGGIFSFCSSCWERPKVHSARERCKKHSGFGGYVAGAAHGFAIINMLVVFELLWFLENWDPIRAILSMLAVANVQRCLLKILVSLLLTREFNIDEANRAWWTGRWNHLGWYALSQPPRELACKIMEMTLFATDFIVAHVLLTILFIFCLIPYADRWHSMMLLWLRPTAKYPAFRNPIYSRKQRKKRIRRAVLFGMIFGLIMIILITLVLVPLIFGKKFVHLVDIANLPF
ncbi:uncharacterized protein VTP21DRAFT_7275 [Calcarisporiella thermophila]|uniref:uncharacterized protein n=1 Tax=Calcarisporiella thermophila TaxID=911321 RepID=UPI003741E90A